MAKALSYKTPIRVKFGEKIRQIRIKQNKFLVDVAEDADITDSYLGMIERGERNISLDNVEKLAKALRVKVKDLFEF